MLTKIIGRVVSQDGAVIEAGTVLFQTKKSGIYAQSLRAPGHEVRNIVDGVIEDISLTPGVYTVHVLPEGKLDAPWSFKIALDGTLAEVDLFEHAPIDEIDGFDKTSLIAAIADSVNPVLGGYVEDAQAAQTAAKTSETNAGVSATNAATSAGTATTQATRAKTEADRAQALANDIGAVATMRVDTTVGTRVFISDGTTEQMISGDTGIRDLGSVLADVTGSFKLSRTGNRVTLSGSITATVAGTKFLSAIPNGFRPTASPEMPVYRTSTVTPNGKIRVVSSGLLAWYGPDQIGVETLFEMSWLTTQAWPTVLPGTPA